MPTLTCVLAYVCMSVCVCAYVHAYPLAYAYVYAYLWPFAERLKIRPTRQRAQVVPFSSLHSSARLFSKLRVRFLCKQKAKEDETVANRGS